jgi:hypothetical protein
MVFLEHGGIDCTYLMWVTAHAEMYEGDMPFINQVVSTYGSQSANQEPRFHTWQSDSGIISPWHSN